MNREERDRNEPIIIKKIISILPNDYVQLTNKPTINGITIEGDKTATELSLLSSNKEDYETVTLSEMQNKDRYLIGIGDDKTYKVSVDDVLEETKNVSVTEELDTDAADGTIQFVLLKD